MSTPDGRASLRDLSPAQRAERRDRIHADVAAIEDAHAPVVRGGRLVPGKPISPGERERLDNLHRGLANLDAVEDALAAEGRSARLAAIEDAYARGSAAPAYQENTMSISPAIRDRPRLEPLERPEDRAARSAALRTIEAHRSLDPAAADRLDEVVRRPEAGPEARYIAAGGATPSTSPPSPSCSAAPSRRSRSSR